MSPTAGTSTGQSARASSKQTRSQGSHDDPRLDPPTEGSFRIVTEVMVNGPDDIYVEREGEEFR